MKSHDALESIEPAAAVLIDGDHNWYAVHRELELLEKTAVSADRRFPLVILHDMEWPYARRDMYWDPETIPTRWRQPWARDGIRWDQKLLDKSGKGINRGNAHAIEEGGSCNGVLTAVEDFISESGFSLELRIVHGDHGIGILLSRDILEANPAVRDHWNSLHSSDFAAHQIRQLSGIAAMETAARKEAGQELERLRSELDAARTAAEEDISN
jgi:hypothetical protein